MKESRQTLKEIVNDQEAAILNGMSADFKCIWCPEGAQPTSLQRFGKFWRCERHFASTAYGFTGTRKGMTMEQVFSFHKYLLYLPWLSFHHGGAEGADTEAHNIVLTHFGVEPVLHLPKEYKAKYLLERNREIVDASQHLIATPKGFKAELRSGTWATIRYAWKSGIIVTAIWPDGRITLDLDHRIPGVALNPEDLSSGRVHRSD